MGIAASGAGQANFNFCVKFQLKYFNLAAVTGGRNTNSQPAKSTARCVYFAPLNLTINN